MATIKKTNIYEYIKSKLSNTASHIKMNGTQSAGSSDLMARADHVHPVDTSRAPKSHASSNSGDYGVSTASNYGHAKASGTTPKALAASASVGSETGSFARGDHVHPVDTASTSAKGIVQLDSVPTASSSNAVTSGGLKTALDLKQNEVETQAKVTQFTNKDRINIHRILQYIDTTIGDNHYYDLHLWMGYSNPREDIDDKCPGVGMGVKCTMTRGRNHGTAINDIPYTLKKTDGTVVSTSGTTTSAVNSYDGLPFLPVGIHYLYAEVNYDGSVWKSNILSVFVKDTNNLVSYNSFSGGEYDGLNGITSGDGQKIIVSQEHSVVGESSFKVTRIGDSGTWTQVSNVTTNNNSFSASFDVLSRYCNGSIILLLNYTDGSNTMSFASFIASDTTNNISVSGSGDSGKTVSSVSIRVQPYQKNVPVYVDNVRLISN